ncbi:MAG: adenylate/guanylate cyclase domain-containing protein, partial [Leptospiraceae bacterium]|nr:adenylate/guanylate cyclase domain-containing protein [Leptospiraceae bacterium]
SSVGYFYLNGQLIGHVGRADPYESAMGTYFLADIPAQFARTDRDEQILSIALYTRGDYPLSINAPMVELGTPLGMYLDFFLKDIFTGVLLALYLLVGLMHIFFFIKRPVEKYNFYFGMFCIVAASQWFFNTGMRHVFFQTEVLLRERLDKTTLFLMGPFLVFFFTQFYYRKNTRLAQIFAGVCALLAVLVWFMRMPGIDICLQIWFPVVLFGFGYSIYINFRELRRKNPEARYIMLGILIFAATATSDILNSLKIIHAPFLSEYGFMFFVLGIAGILGNRFMNVYNESDRLNKNLRELNSSYSRFVPHEFLQHLGKNSITDVELGDGIERNFAVLFSDMRDFTAIAESMRAEETLRFLNAYLTRLTPIISSHQGFIDKFIGDAVMALFPENPVNGLRAAIAIFEQLNGYNERRTDSGQSLIRAGCGLHFGEVILGTV